VRRKYTNREAFLRIFWEHKLSPGPFPYFCDALRRPGAWEARFTAEESIAQTTLAAMRDERERAAVEAGNRILFHGRLTPGPELLTPGWPDVSDAALERYYTLVNAYSGSAVAKAIRLERDLQKYGDPPACFAHNLTWRPIAGAQPHPAWQAESYTVRMQPFPSQHLYRMENAGAEPIWEFDDWPVDWSREWREA